MILLVPTIPMGAIGSGVLDRLAFGEQPSEHSHNLTSDASEVSVGGLGVPARRLLPRKPRSWDGGRIGFDMKVDPEGQNYFTVKLWGSDVTREQLVLFCEGLQIGYHRIGDVDLLDFGSDSASPGFNNRFFYNTSPLPLSLTKGHTHLHFEIRGLGYIFSYGSSWAQYQQNFDEPSRGIYSVYTHTEGFFEPPQEEKQGSAPPSSPPIRTAPGPEVFDQVKARINRSVDQLLAKPMPLTQMESYFLARAYRIEWTHAFRQPHAIELILASIDDYIRQFRENPKLVEYEPSTYNPDWFGFGPWGQVVEMLSSELLPKIDDRVPIADVSRREGLSAMLVASRDYLRTHRRWYTNQTMIVDLYMYTSNRGLRVINPSKALPEKVVRRYLYESTGLQPWLGSDGPDGKPNLMLGDSYYQLTKKGLTRELGYVGTYGEAVDWFTMIYQATCGYRGGTGDPKLKAQLEKMVRARSYFRYPQLDRDGFKAMRLECMVGWRDAHYPGDVVYAERQAWDGSTLYMPTVTGDPRAIGAVQQMFADNQFFAGLVLQMKFSGNLRTDGGLMDTPDQFKNLSSLATSPPTLPMSGPDFAWADEQDGVLAVKNGEDILYVSLYWRARAGINFLARVHYVKPNLDRIAVVQEDIKFEPSGHDYIRPDEIDSLSQGSIARPEYGEIHSALAGEKLPIPVVPSGTKYRYGDESVYAGRGDLYTLRYGRYLIYMNMSESRSFQVQVPTAEQPVRELISGKMVDADGAAKDLKPLTTLVYYQP